MAKIRITTQTRAMGYANRIARGIMSNRLPFVVPVRWAITPAFCAALFAALIAEASADPVSFRLPHPDSPALVLKSSQVDPRRDSLVEAASPGEDVRYWLSVGGTPFGLAFPGLSDSGDAWSQHIQSIFGLNWAWDNRIATLQLSLSTELSLGLFGTKSPNEGVGQVQALYGPWWPRKYRFFSAQAGPMWIWGHSRGAYLRDSCYGFLSCDEFYAKKNFREPGFAAQFTVELTGSVFGGGWMLNLAATRKFVFVSILLNFDFGNLRDD